MKASDVKALSRKDCIELWMAAFEQFISEVKVGKFVCKFEEFGRAVRFNDPVNLAEFVTDANKQGMAKAEFGVFLSKKGEDFGIEGGDVDFWNKCGAHGGAVSWFPYAVKYLLKTAETQSGVKP